MSEAKGDVKENYGIATQAVHGHNMDLWSWRPTILPIVTSNIFQYNTLESLGDDEGFQYGRYGNPTRSAVEETLARLEGAQYGFMFSSGMSAVVAVLHLFKPGDHIICSKNVYGGVTSYFNQYSQNYGMELTYVKTDEESNISKAVQANTKLIWLEALTNPTLQVTDIKAVSESLSRRPDILIVVDNTFLTPCLYKPLNHGAHIVMNSISKYINGHGDVLMGSLATNDATIAGKLKNIQIVLGNVPPPFDCYLVNRSLKTLKIRMREHGSNALKVATFLEQHPCVQKVIYPGLRSHPQHEKAKSLYNGFGGMVAFYLKGTAKNTEEFILALKVSILTASLGSPESIMSYPWTISHGLLSPESKRSLGITETFVRLSVGLEDAEDIIEDLNQALNSAKIL